MAQFTNWINYQHQFDCSHPSHTHADRLRGQTHFHCHSGAGEQRISLWLIDETELTCKATTKQKLKPAPNIQSWQINSKFAPVIRSLKTNIQAGGYEISRTLHFFLELSNLLAPKFSFLPSKKENFAFSLHPLFFTPLLTWDSQSSRIRLAIIYSRPGRLWRADSIRWRDNGALW